ncbi:hypothetical protein CEXT_594531 [Caerostris extrusa]|uniref:Uncharacterized protein n=1 Tax=Caerostris extrusa TaxID=172846 RepID=A0AAV4Q6X6_CAEEX|nr:hypothetical protein CEXT_594531 [Caerostris extrusa]
MTLIRSSTVGFVIFKLSIHRLSCGVNKSKSRYVFAKEAASQRVLLFNTWLLKLGFETFGEFAFCLLGELAPKWIAATSGTGILPCHVRPYGRLASAAVRLHLSTPSFTTRLFVFRRN